jgi:hypothetical protein
MPNHVINYLTVLGNKKEINKCLKAICLDKPNPKECNDNGGIGTIDFRKIIPEPLYFANTDDMLEWHTKNWGTKWNAYEQEKLSNNCFCFMTAWYSPHKVIACLSELAPNLHFVLGYVSEDYTTYNGLVVFHNGAGVSYDIENVEQFAINLWNKDYKMYSDFVAKYTKDIKTKKSH